MQSPQSTSSSTQPAAKSGLLRLIVHHENITFLVLAAVWLMLLYGRLLSAPFVSGDIDQIGNNPALASWHEVWTEFVVAPVRHTAGFNQELRGIGQSSSYRPLYWLSLALDTHLWGIKPAGFHATNLFLTLLAGFFGFRLLRALHVKLLTAAGAALVWLGLPVNTEVVAWVSARTFSLCAIFVFLALISAVHATRSTRRLPWLMGYFFASLAALFAHPAGLLILPLAILIGFAASSTHEKVNLWAAFAGLGAIADAFWFTAQSLAGAAATGSHAGVAANVGLSFFRYLRWMLLPFRMSVERSTSLPGSGLSLAAVLAWIGIFALAGAALWIRRRHPVAAAGFVWMGLGLIPFCGLLAIDQGMAERFVYIASAGFALLIVSIATESTHVVWRRTFAAVLLLWAAWGGWRSLDRAADWGDPERLYTTSLLETPDSSALYYNLGLIAREKRDYVAGANFYRQALRLHPDQVQTMLQFAALLDEAKDPAAAETQLRRVLAVEPHGAQAYIDLGMLLYEEGSVSDAEAMFGAAIRYNPKDPTPYLHLAQLYQEGGEGDVAMQMYKKVLKMKPGDKTALDNMKMLKASMDAAARNE